MAGSVRNPSSITARLNFAADRVDGGIWCNSDRSRITQSLTSATVEVTDARSLAMAPSLEREGFEIHHAPVGEAQWDDPDWVRETYVPQSLALVQRASGAGHVAPFYNGRIILRDTGNASRAPAAEFVHLDQTRESGIPSIEMAADAELRRAFVRVKIFNVWRGTTPPPQDVPLAMCDQRTLDPADWVVGRTVEPAYPEGVPYLSCMFNPRQRWFYVPRGQVPRASVELRVVAFFLN